MRAFLRKGYAGREAATGLSGAKEAAGAIAEPGAAWFLSRAPSGGRDKNAPELKKGKIMISKKYSDFLKEIIDDSMKTACEHSDEEVTDFFTSNNISCDEAYAYFLKHYGNDYIKDGFVYCRKNEKYEMNILFGLDSGNGNICNEI